MSGLFHDFERFFDSSFKNSFDRQSQDVDILKKKDHILIKCLMPGVDKKNIRLKVKDGVLIVYVKKESQKSDEEEDGSHYMYRSIRTYGSSSKRIPLPEGVREKTIQASYENGILIIKADYKPKDDNSRYIKIK